MRMQDFTVEAARKIGVFGFPVVSVCNNHGAVVAGCAVREGNLPKFAIRAHVGDFRAKSNMLANSKMIYVAFKISQNIAVVSVIGKIVRHGKIAVAHVPFAGNNVKRAIAGRQAVVVVKAPIAADSRSFFKTIERDIVFFENFGCGNTRRTCADNANFFRCHHFP